MPSRLLEYRSLGAWENSPLQLICLTAQQGAFAVPS